MILEGYEGNNQKFTYANMGCVYFSCNNHYLHIPYETPKKASYCLNSTGEFGDK